MPIPNFDPVLLQLGPFAIRWYALGYVVGILVGWRYAVGLVRNDALYRLRPPPATAEQIDDLVLWLTLGIIIGGRLGHVLFYTPELIWTDPVEILRIWNGGMSFHGGALGVLAALVAFAARNRIDVWRLADVVVAAAPFGIFLVRIANFINGELWGRPTDLPWGVVFCNDHIRETYSGACPQGARHPSQLYEAFLEGIVLFLILLWATHGRKWLNRSGVLTGLFAAAYAVFRLAVETVREPDAGLPDFPLGLTMGMMLSIPMLLVGLWLIWRGLRQPLPDQPRAAPAPPAREADEPA